MARSVETDTGDLKPAVTLGLIVLTLFVLAYFFAFPMFGVGRSAPLRRVAAYDAAQAARCQQFIDVARVKFGPDWKHRLDPRDTSCAQEIQAAWEREWYPRETQPEPEFHPTIANAARPLKITPAATPPAHEATTGSLADNGPIAHAGADRSSDDAFDQAGAESSYSRDPRDAAGDDQEERRMSTIEQEHYTRSLSHNDHGSDDDPTDATRALNTRQLEALESGRDDGLQSPSDDDSDADENDDSSDDGPSRDND